MLRTWTSTSLPLPQGTQGNGHPWTHILPMVWPPLSTRMWSGPGSQLASQATRSRGAGRGRNSPFLPPGTYEGVAFKVAWTGGHVPSPQPGTVASGTLSRQRDCTEDSHPAAALAGKRRVREMPICGRRLKKLFLKQQLPERRTNHYLLQRLSHMENQGPQSNQGNVFAKRHYLY